MKYDLVVSQLLGMVRGLVCDGELNDNEIIAFQRWIRDNPTAVACWPGSVLSQRISTIHDAAAITADQRHALYELFCESIGEGDTSRRERDGGATRLPFDSPPPVILFTGGLFCFTGLFVYGSRDECIRAVEARGGACIDTVMKRSMTLVVGGYASRAWAYGSFGRKIEKAVEWREAGAPLQIVSEEHWASALNTPR